LNKEVAAFRAENNLKSQKKQNGIAPRERALRLFTFAASCTVFFDREIGKALLSREESRKKKHK
jgi:hypothetical protein